jgi:hypothetical protein
MHKNGAIVRTLDQELIIAVTVTEVGVQSEGSGRHDLATAA